MVRKVDLLDRLIEESKELEIAGQLIQGVKKLAVSDDAISQFVSRYQNWYGTAINAVLPDFQQRLKKEFSGSWHEQKIKNFLEGPGEVNAILRAAENPDEIRILPYWQFPYETTFRRPLLAQRQILTEAKQQLLGSGHGEDIELVERICRRFGEFLVPLAKRQRQRTPLIPEDEYDVQDLLHGLLRVFFEDVRPEDFSPERGGGRSRIDFVLKTERIVIEAKMTRADLGTRKVGEQLIIDIERYRSHPDCDALVCFVYDPERHITNRRALETDLSGERDGLIIRVVVTQ